MTTDLQGGFRSVTVSPSPAPQPRERLFWVVMATAIGTGSLVGWGALRFLGR